MPTISIEGDIDIQHRSDGYHVLVTIRAKGAPDRVYAYGPEPTIDRAEKLRDEVHAALFTTFNLMRIRKAAGSKKA